MRRGSKKELHFSIFDFWWKELWRAGSAVSDNRSVERAKDRQNAQKRNLESMFSKTSDDCHHGSDDDARDATTTTSLFAQEKHHITDQNIITTTYSHATSPPLRNDRKVQS